MTILLCYKDISKYIWWWWWGLGDPYFFLHISSSWVKIRLHTENQLPGLPGSALKVVLGGWVGGGEQFTHFGFKIILTWATFPNVVGAARLLGINILGDNKSFLRGDLLMGMGLIFCYVWAARWYLKHWDVLLAGSPIGLRRHLNENAGPSIPNKFPLPFSILKSMFFCSCATPLTICPTKSHKLQII